MMPPLTSFFVGEQVVLVEYAGVGKHLGNACYLRILKFDAYLR